MTNYGNPPQDPYGQQPGYGQDPYGQDPYGQAPAYGQGQYGSPYGQPGGSWTFAHWGKRVGAFIIDQLVVMVAMIPYIIGVAMGGASMESTTDPVTGAVDTTGPSGIALTLIILGVVLGIAAFIWNSCIKQGRTGYSIGKGVLGIKLIKLDTGQPIGAGMSFLRQLLHIVDQLPCYLGYLWPLWDWKRQTFADKILSTVVIDQPQQP